MSTEHHVSSQTSEHAARRTILETQSLEKDFGGVRAVSNVNLRVFEGELLSIIGPNGAGKTTLFNLMTGLERPTSGSICFHGHQIQGRRPNAIAELGIARTFQTIRLFNNMTVLENLMGAQYIRTRSRTLDAAFRTKRHRHEMTETIDRSLDLLDAIGLKALADEMAGQLSYGDQRRVEIARGLATQPTMLLLDEPAAGMNAAELERMVELVLTISDRGLTVVLVEHQMDLVMEISHRIVVLDQGCVISEGDPQHTRSDPRVIKAYLGEPGDG